MSTNWPLSSSSSSGISLTKPLLRVIRNSSVALTPMGVLRVLAGTLHWRSNWMAASVEAKDPSAMVSLELPASRISSTLAPPRGNISYFPVIGESTTPEVSGNIMNLIPMALISLLTSLISPGFTKPGIMLTCSFFFSVVALDSWLTMALVMLANPVTCDPA